MEEKDNETWEQTAATITTLLQDKIEDHLKVEGLILGVTEKEVEEALQKMKRGKAPGPSGVTTYLLRYAGETGVRELKRSSS